MIKTPGPLILAIICIVNLASGQSPPPMDVAVCPVTERHIPALIRLVGTVRPDRRAVVASEAAGLLLTFETNEGDFLKKGDVICRIDPTLAKIRLDEAAARMEVLDQRLAELSAGTRKEELRRLKASVDEAQAVFEKWEFEHTRMQNLYAQDAGSTWENHQTFQEYLAAARRLEQAKALLELGENGPRKEVIEQARYEAAAQGAIVALWKRNLDKSEIRAPFDGFITAKRTEIGEWIEEGGPVCEVVDIEKVRMRVDVSESAAAFAVPGAEGMVEIEAINFREGAKVSRLTPLANEAARTFPIEMDVPNPEHRLLPGMFAWVTVPSGPSGKRLMVNKDAVSTVGGIKQIFVVRPQVNGGLLATPLEVRTGLEWINEVEIIAAGVAANDNVVCRANERLFGPTPVRSTPLNTVAQENDVGTTQTNGNK